MLGFLPPVIIVVALLYAGYYSYAPLGGRAKAAHRRRAASSPNHDGKKFVNYTPTSMDMTAVELGSLLRDQIRRAPAHRPQTKLTPIAPSFDMPVPAHDALVTWLGHSAVLVQLKGKTLLLDPMLSRTASPFQFVGPQRFPGSEVVRVEDLPPIDAVIISHDHYDHLDYESVRKLKHKTDKFFVPLGVGAHLERWGVSADRITELDWWESADFGGITLACTPSRHFSGRTLTDRFTTLWASWVIRTDDVRLYFSGDTGYGEHFTQIGKKYGPFDLAMMECGQYDLRWPNVHMQPEQTADAAHDLRARRMLPMHWGAFQLAFHDWTDSVERVLTAAAKHGTEVATPQLGETFVVKATTYPHKKWWQ